MAVTRPTAAALAWSGFVSACTTSSRGATCEGMTATTGFTATWREEEAVQLSARHRSLALDGAAADDDAVWGLPTKRPAGRPLAFGGTKLLLVLYNLVVATLLGSLVPMLAGLATGRGRAASSAPGCGTGALVAGLVRSGAGIGALVQGRGSGRGRCLCWSGCRPVRLPLKTRKKPNHDGQIWQAIRWNEATWARFETCRLLYHGTYKIIKLLNKYR